MLSPSTPTPPRVFIDVRNPCSFLDDLEGPSGAFVSTRLRPPLGEPLLLSVQLEDVVAPIDLPVVVVARRTPRGSGGLLSMGVQVRLVERDHPAAVWLRRVVDAYAAESDARSRVFSVFPFLSELLHELGRMLEGERGLLPVDQPVRIGERLEVKATAEDAPGAVSFQVVVRGTSRHDGVRAFAATLEGDESRDEVRRFLEDKRARHRFG